MQQKIYYTISKLISDGKYSKGARIGKESLRNIKREKNVLKTKK